MSSSQQPQGRNALSALNVTIQALNLAMVSSVPPADSVFGSVIVLLTLIRDSMANERDYVELGLNCAEVCKALDRQLNGRPTDELSQSVLGAIEQLTTAVAEIQKKVVKQGKRSMVSRLLHAKEDKDLIVDKKQDLNRILQIFNTELLMSIILDGRHQLTQARSVVANFKDPPSVLGELPPPAPRVCFGRDELIEKLVDFADNLEPVALIGAGGIGKTSIALSVLHDGRIKDRFGDNRRFIRCDQFHTSRGHFLSRLSKVIGAGIENPNDLVSLRPFLSSREILIVLDNVESILDPQAIDALEIYGMVNELCQFETISLVITSRLTTVPWCCKRPNIPMLSMEAARNIFYSIHDNGGQSGIIDNLLQQLGFHALSVTLLAAAASHNNWDCDELAKEWEMRHGQILRTDYNESLAATIELSLSSPTFRNLGPDARDLLGVVAFFPQGVDERNLDSFFPAITDRKNIFNKFHVLSLTHRRNGFITMLAPIRDYFGPKDPNSFPVLCAVKDSYFTRLSIDLHPGDPGFEEAQWILSEDVNVEHLLDVFTSIDKNTDVWNACAHFMDHLYWHKRRQTVLAAKIKDLPDDHPSKFNCLLKLSLLFRTVGNDAEQKRLLSHILRLERERGNDNRVAVTLEWLSETNRMLDLYEEGIQQAKEALGIYARLGNTTSQASCLVYLARLLQFDKQLDAAVNAAARAIKLLPQRGKEFLVCKSHRVLGNIYFDMGKREMAIHHFKIALGVASPFNWHDQLYWTHLSLAQIFAFEDEFSDAEAHIEQAKTHTVMGEYFLGDAMMLQASIWFRQNRLEDARSELSGALEIFRSLGL